MVNRHHVDSPVRDDRDNNMSCGKPALPAALVVIDEDAAILDIHIIVVADIGGGDVPRSSSTTRRSTLRRWPPPRSVDRRFEATVVVVA